MLLMEMRLFLGGKKIQGMITKKTRVAEVFHNCVSESIHFLGANVQLCIAPGYVIGHPFQHSVPISV